MTAVISDTMRASARTFFLVIFGMLALGAGIGGSLGMAGVFASHSDPATIHACVNRWTTAARIVEEPGDCSQAENLVEWTSGIDLQARLVALEQRLPGCLQAVEGNAVFEGCNVYIRNGEDSTSTANGTGNLIVGYNEPGESGEERSGSHNLIVGPEHSYTSYGAIVAGKDNATSAAHASITGGSRNVASGVGSSVSGGIGNIASGEHASVTGGDDNHASGQWSSINGGESNNATGSVSSITGGIQNGASGPYSSVTGGANNIASGDTSTVSGGRNREADNPHAWVGGGLVEDF